MSSDKKTPDKAQSKRETYSQARSTTESSLPRSPDAKQMKKQNSGFFAKLFSKKTKDSAPTQESTSPNETTLSTPTPPPSYAQPSTESRASSSAPDRKPLRRAQSSAPLSENEEPKQHKKKTAKKTEATPSIPSSDSEEPKKPRKKKKAQQEEGTPSETTITLQAKRSGTGHLPKPSGDVPPLKLPLIKNNDPLPPPPSAEPTPNRTASPVLEVPIPTLKGRLRRPTYAEPSTSGTEHLLQTTPSPVVNNADTASIPTPSATVARVKRHCPKPSGGNGDTPTLSKLRPPSMLVVGSFTEAEAEKKEKAQNTPPDSPGQSPSGSPR